MKRIKIDSSKLSLKKSTISRLKGEQMERVQGGKTATTGYSFCINNATGRCSSGVDTPCEAVASFED